MKFRLNSNAKINIGLRILSKRKDNFHNLETIFYPVQIYDIIEGEISKSDKPKIVIKTNKQHNLNDGNNLCYKAIVDFLKEFQIENHYNIKIKIKKNIPIGAGLGGGSSNAANILKFLVKYFRINDADKLNNLALNLGSDVPFFLLNKPAYATGRGEILKPLSRFKIKGNILLANPGIHISTDLAFKKLNFTARKKKILSAVEKFSSEYYPLFKNDFEEVIFREHPLIKNIKNVMSSSGCIFTSMSGSGSTVYGIFRELKPAFETKNKLKKIINFTAIV